MKLTKSNNIKLPKRNKIDKHKKINFNFENKYNQKVNGFKPSGFWYSCYNDWYNWTQTQELFQYKYIHQININSGALTNIHNKNKDKILVIHNLKEFDIFNKRYAYIHTFSPLSLSLSFLAKNNIKWQDYLVNWDKVSKDYGGIEICPYLKQRRHYLWYNSFDVASGCIWNIKSIIKNSDLIYEKKRGKYVKVSAN